MRRNLLIALLTVFVFGAGYLARLWTERELPLPPPLTPGAEFTPAVAQPSATPPPPYRPPNRAQLSAEIERLRPQIDTFRQRLRAIDAEFDHNLQALLTPAQLERYTERRHRHSSDSRQVHASDTRPLTDQDVIRLHDQPLYTALDRISVRYDLDDLNNDLKLTEAQRAKVGALLLRRRDQFLVLVDSVPPPSLILSRLAAVAQRLAAGPGANAKP